MKRKDRPYYLNDEIKLVIDQRIHSERDRAILKRNLCDNIGYEALAEEFDMSRSQIARIVPSGEKIIFAEMS